MSLIPATITSPFLGYAVLAAFVVGSAGGAYGGYRWAEASVVKCEAKADKKEAAQGKANAKETQRQTTASNRAARGLEADREAINQTFTEVRNVQTETALAQPDRANLVCFDDDWLRLDAAATRAANERSAHVAGLAQALPAPAGAEKGDSREPAGEPNPASRTVRGLLRDSQTPGRVDQAARSPENN